MKTLLSLLGLLAVVTTAAGQESSMRDQAAAALRRGVEFFREHVAVEGTYLWQYSEDLSKREGETQATATQAWVQPPGTPAVGLALLAAWQATSNAYYLDAASETARGLARGQLRSGGWTYSIGFAPDERRKFGYRDGGGAGGRNVTTLDDDTTQAALRFLMRIDQALRFQDAKLHEAVEYALTSLVKAQYPNGAWPQGYDQFPDPEKFPVKPASPPGTWSRTWPGSRRYWLQYTLNDNALATTIETLFEAGRVYSQAAAASKDFHQLAARCRAAAEQAGDFLLLAQMPEPQPAWAQQYDFDMHPAWARKFEPPAVTGGESQDVLRVLLALYAETGRRKYLEPVPRALAYLRRSRLADGRLARFYEVGSNKPLYFTKDYTLTYDDANMPTHYSFKVADHTDAITREYEQIKNVPPDERSKPTALPQPKITVKLLAEVKSVIAAQDVRGRWVEAGRLRTHGANDPAPRVIRSATFNRNIETLSRYLAATRP